MRRVVGILVAVFFVSAFLPLPAAQAATDTWANLLSDWGNPGGWLTGVPGPADVGQFTLSSYTFQPNMGEANTAGGVWNTGAGAVTITGTGLLTINGTTINGNANTGIELDPGAGNLSFSNPIALGGSQQWFNNSSSTLSTFGPLYLGLGNTLTFSGTGQTNVSAPISGQGNLVVGSGASVLLSTTAAGTVNSYVGATQINGGLLKLQGPAGSTLLPQSSAVSLTSGGTLNLNGLNTTIPSLFGDSTSQILLGAGTLSTGALNANTVFAGSISGNGGLTKINGGTFVVSGANSYLGATSISGGVLQTNGGNALPSSSPVFFPGSATLSYLNDGTGNNGSISPGNNITLTGNGITATVNVGGVTGLTTGNTVSFGTLTVSNSAIFNTVNFTAANGYTQSYSGLNLPGSTGASTQLNANSGTVTINGPVTNQMVAGGGFDTLFLGGATKGNQITSNITDGAHFTGVGAGDTRVTLNGSAQWILSGSNTYNGPTTLNQTNGTLTFAGSGALSPNTLITGAGSAGAGFVTNSLTPTIQIRNDGTGNGSTVNLGNNVTMNSTANTTGLIIDVGSLSGAVSGVTVSFGTIANGTATVTPNIGGFFFNGNNGYIAQMSKFALAGSSGATTELSTNNVNVVIGSVATITSTNVVSQQATAGTGFDTANFSGSTSSTSNGGLGNVIYGAIGDSAGFINNGGWLHGETNVQFNANYSGQQGSAQNGNSLWTLAGSESYHGWTNVNGGTLQLGTGVHGQNGILYNSGLLLNGGANYYGNPLLVNNGSTLIVNNFDNQTIAFNMATLTTGSLVKTGAGLLIIGANDNLVTGTTISGGTLQFGAGATSGTMNTSTPVTDNAALSFDLSSAVVYPNTFSGSGAINQIGAGSSTLSSLANFTGTFGVNNGSLFINGSNKSTAITVAGATTLGGTFSAPGSASLGSGATLVVGNGTTGTISLGGGLTFTSGGTVDVGSIGNFASSFGTAAAVNVGGNLSAGSAVTIKLGNGGPGPVLLGGNYQVLGYGGSLLGAGSHSFVLNSAGVTAPTNFSPSIVYSGNAVDVKFNVSNYPIWTGSVSTAWDATTQNWQSSSTSAAETFASNNLAYFGDNPISNSIVISSTVAPYSAYFANNTIAYTLSGSSGSSGIVGSAMLVMNGAGSLTINNSGNTYTGGTYLYNGTLSLGNSSALGSSSGTLELAGGTLDNSSGAPMILPGYPIVMGGNVGFIPSGNALNLGTSAVALFANSTLNVGSSTLTVGGGISGNYGITQTGTGTLLLNGADTFNGNTLVSGGTLVLGVATALQNSTLDTSGAGSINFGTLTAATVGGLTNGGALALTNGTAGAVQLSVGSNGVTNASSAAISGSGGITKVGGALQVLSGNNTYAGPTNVSAGTLQLQGPSALPSGSAIGMGGGVISIANDGGGSGGTISLGNSVTLTAAATVGIDVRNNGGSNGNTVSFGTLSNGSAANAFASTINFTGANGYLQSYAGLNLSGLTGQTTTLNPTTTTVNINGPVANLITTSTGHFDTMTLSGTSTGNTINGVIADSSVYTSVGNGDTRVTKSGVSQWTLNGANTYHGPTNITAGTLGLGSAATLSSLTTSVSSGATFDVSAISGGLVLQQSQTLAGAGGAAINGSLTVTSSAVLVPGGLNTNPAGALNVANVTLNNGSILAYELNATTVSPLLNVSGSLSLGVAGVNLYSSAGASSSFSTPGTYPLATYGSLNGSPANLSVLNPSFTAAYSFFTSGNTLDVSVLTSQAWTGGSLTPAFSWSNGANWSSGFAPTSGSALVFSGTTGVANTNDIPGLSLTGIVFSAGGGAFNLSGNSIQLGGPIVNGSTSTQTVGLAMQLTATTTTITAGGGNIVLAGVLSDAGSGFGITTGGANTVQLAAANTFSGPTTISGGHLDLANGLALQNSTVTLSGGALAFDSSVSSSAFTLGGLSGGNNILLAANTTGYPVNLSVGNNGIQTTYSGVMSGPGSLTKVGAGFLYLSGANTFTGNTLMSNGFLELTNATALQDSTVDTSGAGSLLFGSAITTATVGGLTNGGNLSLQNLASQGVTLSVGNNGLYNASSANISGGSGAITKIGAGLQALSGNNTYTGVTTISAGTLQLQGTTTVTSVPSGGAVSIAPNATLSVLADGTGSGGTISVPSGAITMSAAGTASFQVGNFVSANTGNIVSFGTLANGTPANTLASFFAFNGTNGYSPNFGVLALPGTTGNNTTLIPQSGSVLIGNVVNQITGTLAGHFDTLFLDGTTKGNTIYGQIMDNAGFTSVANGGYTPVTKQNSSQWIILNQQNYHGNTTISGGTLQLGNGTTDGAIYTTAPIGGNVNLSNNSSFVYDLSSNTSTAGYQITGTGSVTVLAGEVTYGSANTYNGATTIASGGSLALGPNATINSTPTISLGNNSVFDVSQLAAFTLRSGQTLTGVGSYLVNGSLIDAAGSKILPGGVASAGTLNVGSLTTGGGTMNFDLSTSATLDLINVTANGGLNLSSSGAILNFYDTSGTNQFGGTPGTYPLMAYQGTLNGAVTNLTIGNPNFNAAYTLSTSAGFVDLIVSVGNGWSGGAGSPFLWSNNGNWSSGAAITSGESAYFQGTTGLTNSNDISGLNLTGIVFAAGAGGFDLTGNSIQISGAINNSSTAAQTIGLAMQLMGSQVLSAAGGNIVVNGVISDGGLGYGVFISGPDAVVLGAANTYTGNTTINSGTLSLANSAAVALSTVSVATSGHLAFAAGITTPSVGGLSGSGNIALVTAASEAVSLSVGGDGQSTTYSGAMSSSGGLVKVGADTLTLNGATANSYSGATLITAGVLQATHNNIMSANSAMTISNASTFDMTNTTQSVGSLSSTDASGNQVLLGTGLLKIAGPGVTTFDGVISGGGSTTLQGGGLTLTNQNLFTGPMTVSGGVLQLNSAGQALTGNLQVSGGTAVWLQSNQVNSSANLGVSSGLANIGGNSNSFNNVQITGGTITGTSGVITSTNDVDARSGTINAILGGSAGLNKTTAGTVVLGAANTYSGLTTVNTGNLTLANPLAVQNSTVNMDGGALAFVAGNTAPSLGGLSGTGNIALATATAQPVALNVGGNAQTTSYSGIMSGSGGLVKQGGGTFQLANYQNYSGTTVVSNGVLQLGPVTPQVPFTVSNFGANTSGAGGSNATWTVNNNGGLTTAITNNVLTITEDEGVAESRSVFYNTLLPTTAFNATFVYTESTGFTYPTDGATFVLQNSTTGITVLGGTGSGLGYTGITPSAGIGINPYFHSIYGSNTQLWLKGGSVVSSSVSNSAYPQSGNPIQMTLSYDGSNMMTTTWTDLSTSGTYAASFAVGNLSTVLGTSAYIGFTGAADTTADGFGSGYATQTFGNFSYTYTATSAPITGNNVLPTSTALSVTPGASVDLYGGNDAVGSLTGAGTVTNSIPSSLAVLTVGNSATTQVFSGVLQDGGGSLGLTVVGPGGLILTGQNNTYSGPTTISGGGTLQLGNNTNGNDGTITGAGGVIDNGQLVYNLFGSSTAAYTISGNTNGMVTKTGGGTLTLASGFNSYGGGTNVLQGLLVIAPGSFALPFGPLNVSGGSLDLEGNTSVISTLAGSGTIGNGATGSANAATLVVRAGGSFSGLIRDGGFGGNAPLALELDGGTLVLSGTGAFSDGTTVTGNNGDAVLELASPTALEAGASLIIGNNPAVTLSLPVASLAPAISNVAAVPEPSALVLLLAAVCSAAVCRRFVPRRNRN